MQIVLPGIHGSGNVWLDIVRAICRSEVKDNWWLADICCHKAPYTSQLGASYTTYVDVQYRGLEVKQGSKFEFICDDVFDWFGRNQYTYEVMICSDGVEHFGKRNSLHLINLMSHYSNKAIIFTPLGELSVSNDTHPDSHKCGLMPDDFSQLDEEEWAFIVLPDFHPELNCGAFFAWHCSDIKQDFENVYNEIKNKYVKD